MTTRHHTEAILAGIAALFMLHRAPAAQAEGHDFINEAKALFRVAACGPGD